MFCVCVLCKVDEQCVTLKNLRILLQVLAEGAHVLRGKNIDPKRAKARTGNEECTKVFVGGLDPNLDEMEIREYFSRFGKVFLILI